MKHIKRLLITLLILTISALFINIKTRFFSDIGEHIPYLAENHPEIVTAISQAAEDVNEFLSHIPTFPEMIANIRNTELPIDPDDIAKNVYYASDTMLTFNNTQNISVSTDGTEVDVYGNFTSDQDKYIVYRFLSENGNTLKQYTAAADRNGNFRKIMYIPKNSFQLAIFTCPEQYGNFTSLIYDYVYFNHDENGIYSITKSPVYDHNIVKFEKNKSLSNALKSTRAVCSDNPSIRLLASEITASHSSNYEKALALHDWVCENIYYDTDSITLNSNSAPYLASEVLSNKRAVCLGYANLYAALCRSVNIPCNVVTGYALGVNENERTWNDANLSSTEANHAWNEVHIDNRWIIVDTTWDSHNLIKDNTMQTSERISHIYFDANMKFFSSNHKIFEYLRD